MEQHENPCENNEGESKNNKLLVGEPLVVEVTLNWASSNEIETMYANQLYISHFGTEFYLTFGELVTPLITDETKFPKELVIKPRVRLAIAPESMKRMAEAIQSNIDKYTTKEKDK